MKEVIWGLVIVLTIIRVAVAQPDHRISKPGQDFWLRQYFQRKIVGWLPGDSGALAAGLVLGGDDDLSAKARAGFRKAGLSHITAASGYNVIVVSGWVMVGLERWINRRYTIYIGMLCIILYMLLAGLTLPVIRAGLMVMFTFAGKAVGRKTDGGWSLVAVSLAMIIFQPLWLFEVGFQLSVAATAGVMWAAGLRASGLKANLWTSLAAWATTLPIILHYFGQMSLVAPLANLAVAGIIPPVMQILGAGLAIGTVWEGGGWLVSMAAWPGLKLLLLAADWFARWPGAAFETGKMGWGWVAGYYLTLSLAMFKTKNSRLNKP